MTTGPCSPVNPTWHTQPASRMAWTASRSDTPRSGWRFRVVLGVASKSLLWYRVVSIPVRYLRGVKSAEGIAVGVERAVADHALAPGDRLPTVRDLAGQLAISPSTV